MANTSSSKYSNIARPYAMAAFEYAREKHELPAWKAFLDTAATMTAQPTIVALIGDPLVSSEKLYSLFSDVLSSQLNPEMKNLLHLLARNKRLIVLPTIAEAFNQRYSALEKISNIRIETAIDLSTEFEQKLTKALAARTKLEVTLECEVNPSIIGGAVIHIGDRVIDGSVRGKLTRLYQSLAD